MTELTLANARRRTKWPLAVHEAGHAVVALRLRIEVMSATIEPNEECGGHVQHEPAASRADMLMTLAGPMAERFLDPDGAQFDTLLGNEEASIWDDLAEYAETIGVELDEDYDERRLQLIDLYKELADEVRELIRENWLAIEAVALALIRHGTLTGRQIATHACTM